MLSRSFFQRALQVTVVTVLVITVFTGCGTHRAPVALTLEQQEKSLPKWERLFQDNDSLLGEAGIQVKPRIVEAATQSDEIFPFEWWNITVRDRNHQPLRLIAKIYTNDDDILTEEAVYLHALKLKLPIPVDLFWGKAKPYANAPVVVFARPNGELLSRVLSQVSMKDTVAQKAMESAARILSAWHACPPRDTATRFKPADWLRQMAEIGRYRDVWDKETQRELVAIAATWQDGELRFLHGSFGTQQVWVNRLGMTTAFHNFERSDLGDPAIDLGSLFADLAVLDPLSVNDRYNVSPRPDYDGIELSRQFWRSYSKFSGYRASEENIARIRVVFYLKLVSFALYQTEDPFLRKPANRVRALLPALVASDPLARVFSDK